MCGLGGAGRVSGMVAVGTVMEVLAGDKGKKRTVGIAGGGGSCGGV